MYCTLDDMNEQIPTDELVALTDDLDAGIVDTFVAERAIADADAEIDGYCGKRYKVPLSPVPQIIRKISVDIAIYNLFSRRQGAPEDRRLRYKDAVKFLENVAHGLTSLGENDPDSTPSPAHRPQISFSDRVHSRTNLKGW